MEEEQQLHRGVLDGIARLEDPRCREERHKMLVNGDDKPRVDRRSLQHLVDFLDNDDCDESDSNKVRITELVLDHVRLVSQPSDGGLNVLTDFFARSDTTLTKVALRNCTFGSQQDASELLAAFQTNTTVTDFNIQRIESLEGAALGNSVFILMQNMPQLQRLDCSFSNLRVEGVRAFQPGLQTNRTLKELSLWICRIGDEGIRLIADALVGNTTMQVLDISYNDITSNGLDDITRLLESTNLKKISLAYNHGILDDTNATQHFVSTLHNKKSSVEELPGIIPRNFPVKIAAASSASIINSLTRNKLLNGVNLLLAPPPSQQQQRNDRTASVMMFKTWHKAITKFAMVPNNTGASAIFKLFQARPQLLEKRLKRPAADFAVVASREQKRRRL